MNDPPDDYGREWIAIPKRRLYALAAVVLLASAAALALLYAYFYGSPFARRPKEAEPTAAFVVSAEGDVKVIRAGTRRVEPATGQTRLRPGDTLQTGGGGGARVALADGSTLSVTEDSVVTVADNSAAEAGSQTAVRVGVARGLVSMRTERQAPGAANVVTTPLASSRLRERTRASFGVYEDRTEEIRVSEGRVETTGAGGSAVVSGGEYAALGPGGAVERREPLLEAPEPFAPPSLTTVTLPGGAPVTLRWSRLEGARAAGYHVQIASSPFFVPGGMILERADLRLPHLILDELRPGPHFWRVRARAETGQLSEWGGPARFTVAAGPAAPPRRGPGAGKP